MSFIHAVKNLMQILEELIYLKVSYSMDLLFVMNLDLWFLCSYLEFLRSLEERVDQDWDGISSSLEEIRKSLLSKSSCLINMTADGQNLRNTEKIVSKFLDSLPRDSQVGTTSWRACLSPENEAIVIPTQVLTYFLSCLSVYSLHISQTIVSRIGLDDQEEPKLCVYIRTGRAQ